MRNRKILLLSFLIAFIAVSCNDKIDIDRPEEEIPPFIEITETDVKAPNTGEMFVIDMTSNIRVSLVTPDWIEAKLIHDPEQSEYGTLKIVVSRNNTKEERVGEVVLSGQDCDPVSVKVTQYHRAFATTCDLTSLSLMKADNRIIKDIHFAYDAKTRTYSAMYLKWIDGENPEKLIPVFETDGDKVFFDGVEAISGVTPVGFDDPIITVQAENGDTKEYKVVFNCPQINTEVAVLHMKPASLIESKNYYVSTEIELYDKSEGSAGDGWWDSKTDGPIEMKARGNSTWGLPKKPFRIKFPVKCSPIGFNHTSERNWVLLAQDMDKSLLRTYIAFEYSALLFNPAEGYHDPKAALFTPHTKYVNVYLTGQYYDSAKKQYLYMDGDYLGLYQMCDRIDRGKGRLDIEPLTRLDGSNPALISGGYLIEADLHAGTHYTSKGIKFTYKYPKDDDYDPAQYSYISNFLNQCESALYSSNYKDPVNGWRKYFDEKTLADFIIIKEFVGDMDGFTSIYAYKRRGVDKLFFGPIWDCDKGWGNDVRTPHWEYPPATSLMMFAGFWMPPYVHDDWFQRVWQDETFRQFVNKRWQQKKGELVALTNRILDEMPVKMQKSIEANFTVWPFNYQHNGEAPLPQKDYAAEIEHIRRLSADRAELLDREFAR